MYSCLLFCFLSFLVCAQTHPGNLPPPPHPPTSHSLSFCDDMSNYRPGFEDVRSDWADKRSKDTVVNSFGKSLLNMFFFAWLCYFNSHTQKRSRSHPNIRIYTVKNISGCCAFKLIIVDTIWVHHQKSWSGRYHLSDNLHFFLSSSSFV